jgi:hypothetical protein
MESRIKYAGIFTNPMPTESGSATTGAGSFVEIGARTKWRVETVTCLNKHPLMAMLVRATSARQGRWNPDFMVIALVV